MPQPIALGTVLGGRYEVTAELLSSAEGDHVLQGEDQILRRRVSIVVPSPGHEPVLVNNARTLAAGSGHDQFQVLDLGQTEDATYLVTSYAPAADLLDSLLVAEHDLEDESLSDDIFGGSRLAPPSPYVYDEPDPTQPHRVLDEPASASGTPAVSKWQDEDYDAYDSAPAAPSVRNKLGLARKVDPKATRSTLFDRAAAAGGAGSAAGAAGAAHTIDPDYDGDNRYESFERTEGKPERLSESREQGPVSPAPTTDDAAPARTAALPTTPRQDRDSGERASTGRAARSGAAGTAGAVATEASRGENRDTDHESPGATSAGGGAASSSGATAASGKRGPMRTLILLLLCLALLAAVVLGFRELGGLTGAFERAPQTAQSPAESAAPQATPSQAQAAEPTVASVSRVTSQPGFMAETDATLPQLIDGNPATSWLSFGFSDANFGNLTDHVGLALQLERPAKVSEVRIDQSTGTGGSFTVYVADQPSLEGAQEVGSGSFTGPSITVPLGDAAKNSEHPYVLIVWDQLPQLTQPIGGYPYGLRIGELTLK